MSRHLIAAIVAISIMAPMAVIADPGLPPPIPWDPPNYAPWGTDCRDWEGQWNPVTTNELCYDPINGWYFDCVTQLPVNWPDFQIDVFFELEIQVYFDWTLAQAHRVSNYDPFELILYGWIEQNGGNYIVVTTAGMLDPNGVPFNLDQLNFIEDVIGRTPPSGSGTPIPITWWYSLVGAAGPWTPMDPDGDDWVFLVPDPCTNDFWIRILVTPYLHQEDGWYKVGGEFCPLANL